jgi:hypothetical protein
MSASSSAMSLASRAFAHARSIGIRSRSCDRTDSHAITATAAINSSRAPPVLLGVREVPCRGVRASGRTRDSIYTRQWEDVQSRVRGGSAEEAPRERAVGKGQAAEDAATGAGSLALRRVRHRSRRRRPEAQASRSATHRPKARRVLARVRRGSEAEQVLVEVREPAPAQG